MNFFYNDRTLKGGSHCIFLSVILIGCFFTASKNYSPQMFLKECNYITKKKILKEYIIDDIFSDASDEEISGNEQIGV